MLINDDEDEMNEISYLPNKTCVISDTLRARKNRFDSDSYMRENKNERILRRLFQKTYWRRSSTWENVNTDVITARNLYNVTLATRLIKNAHTTALLISSMGNMLISSENKF